MPTALTGAIHRLLRRRYTHAPLIPMASKLSWKLGLAGGRVCMKYHPDGKVIFGSSPNIAGWKAFTVGVGTQEFEAHEDAVNGLCVAHNGKKIATYASDGTVLLWNWPSPQDTGDLLTRFDCPVMCADFSACDNLLVCGSQDGTVKIVNVADSNQTRKFKAHDGQVKGVAFDPQRQFLATAGSDGRVNIYDYQNGDAKVASMMVVTPGPLGEKTSFEMDWHPSGNTLAVPSLSGITLVTKPEGSESVWSIGSKLEEARQEAFVVKWSPNGRYLASAHADSSVYLWDALSKLSIDRSKCPDLPLAVQWSRAANTLLLCLVSGRYAEWNGVIAKSLADPIKAFDSASLAAQEYESQKQTLDKMFADEETAAQPAATQSATTAATTSSKPAPAAAAPPSAAQPATRNAPAPTRTNAPSNANPKATSRATDGDDDDMNVDVFAKRHTMDFDLPSVGSRFGAAVDYDDVDVMTGGGGSRSYGDGASFGGGLFEMQAPFMPSSTQGGGPRRILAWTHMGSIVARVEEFPTLQTSLEMDFSDTSLYKPFSLMQPFAVDLATLSEQGVFTASRQVGRDHRVTTTLQFNMFNKFGHKADWSFRLEHGECAVGLAAGDTWSAVATTKRRLRLFGDAGAKMAILALPGPIVSMCAHGPLLGLVFHTGTPLSNGQLPKSFSSSVDAFGVSEDDRNSQTLGWWVFHVPQHRLLSSGSLLPLSPGSTLTWIGFSTEGALCTFDSKKVLRQLAATQHFLPASTPLVSIDSTHAMSSVSPSWSHMWFEVLDAASKSKAEKHDYEPDEAIWPIAVTQDKLRYVTHGARQEGPNVQPKPVPSYMPLSVPFASTSSESSSSAESLESSLARSQVSMACAIGKAIDERLSTEGKIGEMSEEVNDEAAQFIVDLATDKQVLEAQAKVDGLVLKLIREASQEGNVERALGLAKTLVLKKSLQVAITVASKTSQPILADKISEWVTRRENERKKFATATKRMIAPTTTIITNSGENTQSMSLPQAFDNDWTSSAARKQAAKRNAPDLPSKRASSEDNKRAAQARQGSDDEFEVEEDEEEDNSMPAHKKFTTQAIDDDDNDLSMDKDDDEEEEEGNGAKEEMQVDEEEQETRGKDGSVFKSSPFTIAPPFKQGGNGRLTDTLSAIGKSKKSSTTGNNTAKTTKTAASASSISKKASSIFKPAPSKKK